MAFHSGKKDKNGDDARFNEYDSALNQVDFGLFLEICMHEFIDKLYQFVYKLG